MIKGMYKLLLTSVFVIGISTSCGIYSFTGISIDYSKIKTISIANFPDESQNDLTSVGGPSNMSQLFTEMLRDYFQRNTQLSLVPANGDLQIEGEIRSYRVSPQAVIASGNEALPDEAGLMRLTIGVKIIYTNTVEDGFDLNKDFSFFADYDPQRTNLQAEEPRLIDIIFNQIIIDIFNATVATW
jgi:hypothetical protein